MSKLCNNCHSTNSVKIGTMKNKDIYRCKSCNHTFERYHLYLAKRVPRFLLVISMVFLIFSCAGQCELFSPDPNILTSEIDIYFTTIDEFMSIEPHYVSGNNGFFWTYMKNNVIKKSNVFINKDISGGGRDHLIREELTQSLGMFNDSYDYSDSIFYQGQSHVYDYSDLDVDIISMLYRLDIYPGMTKDDARSVLDGIYSEEVIDYFCKIAFGSEFGNVVPVIKKWNDNIKINIHGDYTDSDIDTLNQVVSELNSLINITLYF